MWFASSAVDQRDLSLKALLNPIDGFEAGPLRKDVWRFPHKK
jgi:hypothetical protein